MSLKKAALRIRRRISVTLGRRLLRNHRQYFQERIDRAMEAHGQSESWASQRGDDLARRKARRSRAQGMGILRALARNGNRRGLESIANRKGHPLREWAGEVLRRSPRRS